MMVLKLGGSVITIKEKPMTADLGNIQRLAEEIAASGPRRLVVVHGGGSFGHPVAERYGIAEGFTSREQALGFSETHLAMVVLNSLIVEALVGLAVPAISVTPSSFLVTDGGRIGVSDFDVVRRLVDGGIMPILYGDAVLDRSRGFSILSGDQLAVRLSVELGVSRLVFAVDVDGVYTSNPKLSTDAKLIERLSLERLREMVDVGGALTTDVTGGMLGKVSEAAVAVEAGVEVLIVNASRPGVILKALRGEPVTGTFLTR